MSKNSGTTFTYTRSERGSLAGDVLIVPVLAKPKPPMELLTRVDKLTKGAASELVDVGALREELGHLSQTTRDTGCHRVVLVSLGTTDDIDAHAIRKAAASAGRWLLREQLTRVVLWLDGLAATPTEHAAAEWALGWSLAGFRFEDHRTPEEKRPARIRVQVRDGGSGYAQRVLPDMKRAVTLGDAINYTRRLAHQPANIINPQTLASEARSLARNTKIKCTVLSAPRLKQLKMNGLLAVGQGAEHPSCLIQLEYRGAPNARTTTVLAGKAITFDTGGYSIKPSAGLEGLKFDKTGGATVMGVIKAAADLKLRCNVIGLVATAENAVSHKAYRPGDILPMMSGKTVEVISTDAEGRLILADTLWYAQTKLKPTVLIDVATLTGGVNIALGKMAAGLMGNDDALAADLGEAGRRTHERLWRLPLWDDYRDLIKSTEADIKNSAGKRDAHCIVGGMFLKEFVKDNTPWAHVDIAAVATRDDNNDVTGKGATGFGVRLLTEFLRLRGA